eukprot:1637193-Rhodomonas_salina.2
MGATKHRTAGLLRQMERSNNSQRTALIALLGHDGCEVVATLRTDINATTQQREHSAQTQKQPHTNGTCNSSGGVK